MTKLVLQQLFPAWRFDKMVIMSEPRISIVIPNYNHAHFLSRCLDSHLDQPVLPYEIIVVDDGSTDNSLEVLKGYAERHPVIRVCPNERNLGTNTTINRGLELARGDYVGFLAADDAVRPGLYERFMRILQEHPEAGGCSAMCEWRDTANGMNWFVGGKMPHRACYLSPSEMLALARKGRLAVAGQNAVYKKAALEEAGCYLPELKWFADWFCAYAVTFRYGMCHVPEVLSTFYLYPTSYYQSGKARGERRKVLVTMLDVLASDRFADVAPLIRQSGLLGEFGWPFLRVAAGQRRHWNSLNGPTLRKAARRCAEIVGRRFFPDWLARWCLKTFYRRGGN